MLQKYKIPLQLFIVFEKMQVQLWTSSANQPNHFFIHIPAKWLYSINLLLKKDMSFWNSYLIDSSAVDTTRFGTTNSTLNCFLKNNQLVVFYVYYCFFLKIKLNVSIFCNAFTKNKLVSIDNIYLNANWIEREVSEMFGLHFYFKNDLRRLLLDYSALDNPLLKDYPVEGFFDIFYNFFEDQVLSIESSTIEL